MRWNCKSGISDKAKPSTVRAGTGSTCSCTNTGPRSCKRPGKLFCHSPASLIVCVCAYPAARAKPSNEKCGSSVDKFAKPENWVPLAITICKNSAGCAATTLAMPPSSISKLASPSTTMTGRPGCASAKPRPSPAAPPIKGTELIRPGNRCPAFASIWSKANIAPMVATTMALCGRACATGRQASRRFIMVSGPGHGCGNQEHHRA